MLCPFKCRQRDAVPAPNSAAEFMLNPRRFCVWFNRRHGRNEQRRRGHAADVSQLRTVHRFARQGSDRLRHQGPGGCRLPGKHARAMPS